MIDKKWLLGVGASTALAFSALVTPLSASAQEDINETDIAPSEAETQVDNGWQPISADDAAHTATDVVPGSDVEDVHLDYMDLFGFPPVDVDFGEAGAGLGNETEINLNLVYVVKLTNDIDVTIDADTGTVVDVDEEDEVIDEDEENGLNGEDAVDEDDNGVIDDDPVEDDANGLNGEDTVDEDENGLNGDDGVEGNENGIEEETVS